MNGTRNDDPMGEDYWRAFDRAVGRVESERNQRNSRYGGMDPTCWGWRHSTAAELAAEREEQQPESD